MNKTVKLIIPFLAVLSAAGCDLIFSNAMDLNPTTTTTAPDPFANIKLQFTEINGTTVTPTNYLVIDSAHWPVSELKFQLDGVAGSNITSLSYSLNYGSYTTNKLYREPDSSIFILSNISIMEFDNSFEVFVSNAPSGRTIYFGDCTLYGSF